LKKIKSFSSLKFKSWSYFVLFALSILLLLQFFQSILFEQSYKGTLEKEIKSLTTQIENIYFKSEDQSIAIQQVNEIVSKNQICVLFYETSSGQTTCFDATNTDENAIYVDGKINFNFINELKDSSKNTIIEIGQLNELSTKSIMVYGIKQIINEQEYYIFGNIALENTEYLYRTVQNQFIIISIIIMILAILISVIFSTMIAEPILSIKDEANKISTGDYNLNFEKYDINELDELAETIDIASKEVEKVDVYRKEFLANVSHDLKTPLTMIKAYAEMIKDISGENKEKRNEHLNIILQETDNLTKLVGDILNLSKYQDGTYQINFNAFSITSVINEATSRFKTMVKQDGIKILTNVQDNLIAYGDKERITEVLYNFVSNGLKHIGEDKTLTINAYISDNQMIRVEVIDHGCGIDEELLPYIWDRYYKIDKSYQRSQTGTGLGLAISKAILEAHHVGFGVESKINSGSTFYFELEQFNSNK